ncbi:hypothetical protein EKH57_13475 [Halorubrum sp. BOL3-1]|uniref:hypothetical protein n=1 Tax=Halorubrum sp. BOL3-1 TaxID=2497325 RepID=UPI001004FB3B|nr:hypothetical protein [Halorubrum sp. BOL3-1]QAU13646.1 hypothetical protein EKH57_13475 [Halorubrum sp. BOL3-1]
MTDEERGRGATDDPATDPTHDPQPMTDDTDDTDRTTPDSDRTDADDETDPDDSGTDRLSTDDLRGLLDRVGLAALSLLAVVAGWGFYSQSGNAIRTWFDPAYQPVALAVFNLAVLFVALAGVTHQLRRIRADDHSESTE